MWPFCKDGGAGDDIAPFPLFNTPEKPWLDETLESYICNCLEGWNAWILVPRSSPIYQFQALVGSRFHTVSTQKILAARYPDWGWIQLKKFSCHIQNWDFLIRQWIGTMG